MTHGFGELRVPVTVVGCIHHLGDTDGVEHIGQDCFLGLAGKADLLVSLPKQAFSITYLRPWGRMSPKCLHGESLSVSSISKRAKAGKLVAVLVAVHGLTSDEVLDGCGCGLGTSTCSLEHGDIVETSTCKWF